MIVKLIILKIIIIDLILAQLYALYLVISDVVLSALISGIVTLLVLILTFINNAMIRKFAAKSDEKANELKVKADELRAEQLKLQIKQDEMHATQEKISTQQDIIHKQIDGQQDALMEMTGRARNAEGKAEVKDEVINILKQTEPLKDNPTK